MVTLQDTVQRPFLQQPYNPHAQPLPYHKSVGSPQLSSSQFVSSPQMSSLLMSTYASGPGSSSGPVPGLSHTHGQGQRQTGAALGGLASNGAAPQMQHTWPDYAPQPSYGAHESLAVQPGYAHQQGLAQSQSQTQSQSHGLAALGAATSELPPTGHIHAHPDSGVRLPPTGNGSGRSPSPASTSAGFRQNSYGSASPATGLRDPASSLYSSLGSGMNSMGYPSVYTANHPNSLASMPSMNSFGATSSLPSSTGSGSNQAQPSTLGMAINSGAAQQLASFGRPYGMVPTQFGMSNVGAPMNGYYPYDQNRQMLTGDAANKALKRKHNCVICGKEFARPSALQTHIYSHTGEKPFRCDHDGCGRSFSVVSNLRRHKRVHMK